MIRNRPFALAAVASSNIKTRIGFIAVQELEVVVVSHPAPPGEMACYHAEAVVLENRTADPGARRYWRVLILETVDGGDTTSVASIQEIEMRATPGGADQASGGTALSSSEASGTFADDNAFDDGSASEAWVSATGGYGTQWIGYDFGSAVEVQQVAISKRTDNASGHDEAPIYAEVQRSDDGSAWTRAWTICTTDDWAAGAGAETRVFTAPYA